MAAKKKPAAKSAATLVKAMVKMATSGKPNVKLAKAKEVALARKSTSPLDTRITPAGAAAMQQAKMAAAQVSLMKIGTPADASQANTMLVQLKTAEKNLTAQRDVVVKPLKDHVKTLEGLFKPTLDTLKNAEMELKKKVIIYQSEKFRAEQDAKTELLKAASAAQEEGDSEAAAELATQAIELSEAPKTVQAEGGGQVQTKGIWTFEVEDLGEVPRAYFSFDESAVRRAIRSGVREIPGMRIFQEQQLAVTASLPEAMA